MTDDTVPADTFPLDPPADYDGTPENPEGTVPADTETGCSECKGYGWVEGDGIHPHDERCDDCDGTGKFWSPLCGWVDEDVCGWCHGTGKAG